MWACLVITSSTHETSGTRMPRLLTALIVHGCITDDLSVSTVLPIPKGMSLNYAESANYRGLAASSLFGNTFDAYVAYLQDTIPSCLKFTVWLVFLHLYMLYDPQRNVRTLSSKLKCTAPCLFIYVLKFSDGTQT